MPAAVKPAPAAAVEAAPAPTPAEPAPGTPEGDAAAVAMFDAAMAADPDLTPLPEGEPPDKGSQAPPAAVEGEEPPPEGQEPPVEGAGAVEGEPPAPKVEAAKPVEPAKVADADAKAQIEKEITDRGLKGDTATRFRELSHQVRELSTLRDEVVPALQETARLHDQWQQIVSESTATAPQLEQALAYIQSVNSGDMSRLEVAAKAMMAEVTWAYKKLGWELPGVVDPLEGQADLLQQIEDGDLTRAGALEIVKTRVQAAANAARDKRTNSEEAYAAALDAVGPAIDTLSARLKAADPNFLIKLPALKPTVDLIKQTLHPSQWAVAIERAYRALPEPARPAPRPRPSPMPLRPTGGTQSASVTVRKFTKEQVDAGDPFEMGVREASGR
jgi:hypothetical protein